MNEKSEDEHVVDVESYIQRLRDSQIHPAEAADVQITPSEFEWARRLINERISEFEETRTSNETANVLINYRED